jgi:ankyrin repeat protein
MSFRRFRDLKPAGGFLKSKMLFSDYVKAASSRKHAPKQEEEQEPPVPKATTPAGQPSSKDISSSLPVMSAAEQPPSRDLFSSLPVDIILCIVDALLAFPNTFDSDGYTAVARLARASSAIHAVVNPHLYKHDMRTRAFSLYWACVKGRAETARLAYAYGAQPNHRWVVAGDVASAGLLMLMQRLDDGLGEADGDDGLGMSALSIQDGAASRITPDNLLVASFDHSKESAPLQRLEERVARMTRSQRLQMFECRCAEYEFPRRETCNKCVSMRWEVWQCMSDVGTRTISSAVPQLFLNPRQMCLPSSTIGRVAYAHADDKLDAEKVQDAEDRDVYRDSMVRTSWSKGRHPIYEQTPVFCLRFNFSALSALHLAAFHGHVDVVEVLLDNGTEVDFRSAMVCGCEFHCDNSLWWQNLAAPAMHTAIHQKRDAVVDLLIARGAQLLIKRQPPIPMSCVGKEVEVAWSALEDCMYTKNAALAERILAQYAGDWDAMHTLLTDKSYNHYSLLENALKMCAQPYQRLDDWFFDLLITTANRTRDDAGRILLNERFRHGNTILTAVLFSKSTLYTSYGTEHEQMVLMLLKLGADPACEVRNLNKGDHYGDDPGGHRDAGAWTLLHIIGYWPFRGDAMRRLVRTILDAGVDIDQQDALGNTALHEAMRRDRIDSLKTLIEFGADSHIRNDAGETPWDLKGKNPHRSPYDDY